MIYAGPYALKSSSPLGRHPVRLPHLPGGLTYPALCPALHLNFHYSSPPDPAPPSLMILVSNLSQMLDIRALRAHFSCMSARKEEKLTQATGSSTMTHIMM